MTSLHPTPDNGMIPYTGRWTLDPTRSSFTFRTKAMWVLPVKGTVSARSGSVHVGEDGTVDGKVVLDTASLTTGMKKRDAHLQTADFFDVSRYPTFDFELTGARLVSPNKASIAGALTIHGQRNPVSFEADIEADATTATLSGTIDDIDRSQWEVSWAKMGAGVHNKIIFRAVFTNT